MTYVDGFTYAVPKANKDAFIAYADKCAKIFRKHGALRVVEGWADDVPDGEVTSFPMAVKLKTTEDVLFSWIEWPSKEKRDKAYEKITAEMEQGGFGDMPFDGKRLIYGGFELVVDV